MRGFVAFLILGVVAMAADRCTLPAELSAFVSSLPADGRARREALEARLARTPGDLAIQRVFVDSAVYARKPDRDRYQQLLAAHPNNIDYQYLQARSLVGSDTKQALQLYARILEKDPDYPWVHLSLSEIYRSEAFRDRAKLAASIATVQRVCPSSLVPYSYVNEVTDNEAAANAAVKLRALLKDSSSAGDLRLYSTLWALEFRVRPTAEHDEERKQVAEDLKRLMPLIDDARVQGAIENGARLVKDKAVEQRMTAMRKTDPRRAVMEQSNAWLRGHPRPKDGDSAEVRHAYGKELLARADEWRKLTPDDAIGNIDRVRALAYLDATPDEIGRAGDDLLSVIRRDRSSGGVGASWLVSLARLYVEQGVLLDRVPALCNEAMSRFDDPEAAIDIDLAPSPRNAANRQMFVTSHVEALVVLARMHEKQGEKDKAHAIIWQATDYLASKAPATEEKNQELVNWQNTSRRTLLRANAEMAEREGRKLDALIGYRETVAVDGLFRNELTALQQKLWKELGGTDEGWQQWLNQAVPPVAASNKLVDDGARFGSAAKRKLPPLTARDTNGGQWTLDRFAGKTVIAVVWATWCEPCRAELPYFAKLAERLKGRGDVLAVSFNTDDNIAVADAFAKSYGYTFPVLAVKQYAEDLMPMSAIPRTWIIKDGVISKEHIGFVRDGDKWVEQMLAELR